MGKKECYYSANSRSTGSARKPTLRSRTVHRMALNTGEGDGTAGTRQLADERDGHQQTDPQRRYSAASKRLREP